MNINIELTEYDLKKLVADHLREKLGDVPFKETDIRIEVKSKQNFRGEWEEGAYRARLVKAT